MTKITIQTIKILSFLPLVLMAIANEIYRYIYGIENYPDLMALFFIITVFLPIYVLIELEK